MKMLLFGERTIQESRQPGKKTTIKRHGEIHHNKLKQQQEKLHTTQAFVT